MGENIKITQEKKRLFSTYISYRLGLGILLTLVFVSGFADDFFAANNPALFLYTNYIYIVACAVSLILYTRGYLRPITSHILLILVIDFIAIILMIHAINKANIGLSYLLLIAMSIGGTFLSGRTSIALAAFASLLTIVSSVISEWTYNSGGSSIFTAGVTGVLLFATAICFRLLSKKIESNESKLLEQAKRNVYIQHISQRIIETIQAGIIIVDKNLSILLINNAAEALLSSNKKIEDIKELPGLQEVLALWQGDKRITPEAITINLGTNRDIKINFTNISDPSGSSLMLFIEDERRINQEAQERKLASLGRLTASIAHEIRNPLGAISHASQLLDESQNIHADDQELLSMINLNSQRINTTINSILSFSRRKKAHAEIINITDWFDYFSKQYKISTQKDLILKNHKKAIHCNIDPNHLNQIINNLVDNGFRHGNQEDKNNSVTIEISTLTDNKQVIIDIIDDGEGIKQENIDSLFEPFYTTSTKGSGLGLYLCKELCQANQAEIIYLNKTQEQKSCFRLILNQTLKN